MKLLSKQEWILIHGECIILKPAFITLGWKWTPQLCRCRPPCYLDTDSKNRR